MIFRGIGKAYHWLEKCDIRVLSVLIVLALVIFQMFLISLKCAEDSYDMSQCLGGAEVYGEIAENIVVQHNYSRDGIHPTARRAPVYPLFFASLIWLMGDNYLLAALILQSIMYALTGLLLFSLSLKMFKNRLGGLVAVLLYAAHLSWSIESLVRRETVLFALLMLLFFRLLAEKDRSLITDLGLSLTAALAYLTRATAMFFLPLLLVNIVIRHKDRKLKLLQHTALSGIVFLIVVSPWYAYVYRNFSTISFMPTSSHGLTAYQGNNPNFLNISPYVDVDLYAPFIKEKLEKEEGIDLEVDELEMDEILGKQAREYMLEKPLLFVWRGVIKFLALYSPIYTPLGSGNLIVDQDGKVMIQDFRPTFTVYRITFVFITTLILVGSILFFRNISRYSEEQRELLYYILALFALLTLAHLMTFGESRYRLPFDTFMIMFTGEFLANAAVARRILPMRTDSVTV